MTPPIRKVPVRHVDHDCILVIQGKTVLGHMQCPWNDYSFGKER